MSRFDEFLKSRLNFHQSAVNENLDNESLEFAARHRLIYKELELILKEYLSDEPRPDWLSVEQVANVTGASKSTITRAANDGELKGKQISRAWLFNLPDVLEYQKKRKRGLNIK